ncbi:MAG: hypothetical protein OXU20_35840 [Myxococcales bacterium]|nr:hypothetical protein [Myxococcales bacterium]
MKPAVAAPDLALRVSHLHPGQYAFGSLANVSISIWLCQATEPAASEMKASVDEIMARYPNGASAILWLSAGTELPTAGARKHFVDILRTHGSAAGEVGAVLAGGGFWASAVRAMLTGLKLASAGTVNFRVEGDLESLIAWFPDAHFSRTRVHVPGAALAKAVTDLLARTRQQDPAPGSP